MPVSSSPSSKRTAVSMAEATDLLQRLLDDPEVLAAAEDASPDGEAVPTSTSAPGSLPPELLSKLPALMGALSPALSAGNGQKDQKTALLLSLKPYMSPQRCEVIDKLIMLGRIGEIFRQLR